MKIIKYKSIIYIIILLVSHFSYALTLPRDIADELKKYKIPNDSLGIYISELDNNQEIINWQSDMLFNPASTMKLITTYAGLDLLGPEFSWKTRFYVDSAVINGVLQGDLYIKGSGDPLLNNDSFEVAIKGIINKGIHTINGNLVIDNSYFQIPQAYPNSIDGLAQKPYNALPNAANINFGIVQLDIYSTKKSKKLQVLSNPYLPNFKIHNKVKLRSGRCRSRYLNPQIKIVPTEHQSAIYLSGQYAKRCGKRSFYRVLTRADQLLFSVFKELWLKNGGAMHGNYRVDNVPELADHLYTLKSAPLLEQIAMMNKRSNNVMTRQLFLTMSAEIAGEPGTLENSRILIDQWLIEKGIDGANAYIDNGSGLSRKSKLSAKFINNILTDAATHQYANEFMRSLSIAGIDGTMRNRFSKHPAKGNFFLKTGTLNGVSSLAGYIKTQSGKLYTLVALQQYPKLGSAKGKRIQNKILNWAYKQ